MNATIHPFDRAHNTTWLSTVLFPTPGSPPQINKSVVLGNIQMIVNEKNEIDRERGYVGLRSVDQLGRNFSLAGK
jgi:hypothetical protein